MNNNTIMSAIIVGGVALAGATAIAVNSGYNPLKKYATVVAVAPAFEPTQTARIECGNAAASEGALAAADGEIPRCRTVFDTLQVESGFDVTYELDGVQQVVRMDRNPGSRIPVEDGELVLTPS